MELNKYWLQVFGQISTEILKDYLHTFHQNKSLPKNHIVLFCDRSPIDIPINHKFITIKKGQLVLSPNEIYVVSISQQFFISLDYVPAGWKTICEFDFVSGIPQIIYQLPMLKEWGDVNGIKDLFFE